MGKNFWSKEEECELEEMYKNGLSFKEMSEKLNRTITYDSFNLGNEITELDEDKFLEKLKVA